MRVAEAVRDLGWKYLVLTAVDRDDLPDGGALIFANTVREIHAARSRARESRFSAATIAATCAALDIVMDARPDVFAHNLETVRRLTPSVRDKRAGLRSVAARARARQEARARSATRRRR